MKLNKYEVGRPYSDTRRRWPEGVDFNYRDGAHELRLFWRSPSAAEIQGVKTGRAEFAITPWMDTILFLFRFNGACDWSDQPYSWHLTEAGVGPQEIPPPLDSPDDAAFRQILNVILVDADTGIIKALRAVTFSPEFTRVLHKAIREQAERPFPGDVEYARQIEAAYRRWSSSYAMTNSAIARCVGGS